VNIDKFLKKVRGAIITKIDSEPNLPQSPQSNSDNELNKIVDSILSLENIVNAKSKSEHSAGKIIEREFTSLLIRSDKSSSEETNTVEAVIDIQHLISIISALVFALTAYGVFQNKYTKTKKSHSKEIDKLKDKHELEQNKQEASHQKALKHLQLLMTQQEGKLGQYDNGLLELAENTGIKEDPQYRMIVHLLANILEKNSNALSFLKKAVTVDNDNEND